MTMRTTSVLNAYSDV